MGRIKAMVMILCCLTQEIITSQSGQFIGASMSFTIINGTNGFEVQLDVISGWVLGLGPCGINCSRASITSNTKAAREEVLQKQGDSHFFGNWTVEFTTSSVRHAQVMDINQVVYSSLNENVVDVSEKARWEQVWTVVRYPMIPDAPYMDIAFEGLSWRNLSLQGENAQWHLQTKATPQLRSDTGMPNNSPQAISRPFYRLLLDKDNYIRVATTDPDGDHVTCSLSEYIEGGIASKSPLPKITVTKDCILTIPSHRSLGYHNGSVGAVAITVRDFNVSGETFGGRLQPFSAIGVQFLVQFLDNISEPIFIFPTPEGNHRFNIYSGTTWKIDVYAEPISPALIDHFSCVGRQREDVKIIYVKSTSVPNHVNVKMATMAWTPLYTDVGNHILCVGVEDSYGMDSSDQRCYVLDVKPSFEVNQSMNNPNNKPYFINIPQTGDLLCDANATCIFPIYATTPIPGAKIISIWLGKCYVDWANNDTEIVNSGNGVFKIDISIRHLAGGTTNLCFYAQDSTGAISDEACLNPRIIPPDPCAKIPCRSGICRKVSDDTSQFYCECPSSHLYGQYCEKEVDDCPPGRCSHGICHDLVGPQFYCKCTPGWTGRLCDLNINDCINDRCNNHGICNDEVNGFTCDCFDRYDGDNCTIDRCNTSLQTKSCDQSGCHAHSCTNNGVCTTGGICHCRLGYEGSANCDMGKTLHLTQQVAFVEPTFSDGSTITCYNGERCQFSVFVAGGSNPAVGVQYISEDLKSLLNISVKAQYIPGIQNMFESLVSIDALPGLNYLGHQYICLEAHESGTEGRGISSRCFNILYVEDPKFITKTQEYADRNKMIKFVDPTPKGQSQFICKTNESCHLFVFTNKDNSSICHAVVASSKVYVQSVITRTVDCFTDVSFKFSEKGPRTLCLKADDTDGEKRCFTIDVIVPSEDPCLQSPCKNKGRCLTKLNSTFECICGKEYTGLVCENGPCPATNWPCKHGYCEVNQDVKSCFCPLGYKGENCTDVIPDEVKDPLNNGPIFTDTFIPKEVVCVKNKPCVIPFAISGNYRDPYGPTVQFGFVSPTIQKNGISTPIKANYTNGTYTSEISFTPKLPGNQKVCLQTLNKDMVNVDEICFDVDVKPDAFSFYGDTTKPHFTAPSITQNTTVVCTIGVTCHMMFVVSSGKSNANNCPTMILTEGLEKDFHIFSHCKPCTDGTMAAGNCSMDLVFNPSSTYLGQYHRLCLEAQLLWKRVTGEKRCFNMEVKSGNVDVHGPCRTLQCRNKGFCDSGNSNGQPVCHCHSGYFGSECEKNESTSITNDVNRPYYIDPTLPDGSTVMCIIASECNVMMFTSEKTSNCPTVSEISEISDYTAGLHIFSPASRLDHDCVTDVSYIPPKEMEGQQRRICLQASLPGLEGEIRCYNVIYRANSNPHNATTAPSVLQRSDIECQTTSLKIFVPKNLVPENCPVTWRDSSCVVHSNGTHFVDSVGLRDCGTTLILESDSVVFENDLIFHKNGTQMQNGSNIVTYGSDYEFAIPVKCVYPRNSNISTSYIPIVQQVKILERRNGQLDLTMRQYEAEDYNLAVPFNAYPRQVPLNNDIFIRLAMENNVTGLGLSADNCFATSTPSPVDPNSYQLISSGCPVNNAKIHPSGINDVKFSFHAFNFRHNTSGIVYVHCQVSVCLDTDPACVVGCVTRKKRSASAREGAITSNLISTGPFILTADEGGVAMSTVVAAVSIAVAVIATVVAIIGWTRKSKKGADS